MPSLLSSLRQALRALSRTPGFTLAAVLTLAIGMGGALALFSALHGAVLRTPPYPHVARIHQVILGERQNPQTNLSALQVREFAATSPEVEAITVCAKNWKTGSQLETDQGRQKIPTVWVDAETLPMLGIAPRIGPGFSDDAFASGEGVILTDRFWREHFGGDPAILGRSLPLLDQSQPILGVLPPDAEVPFHAQARLMRPLPPIRPNQRGEYRFTTLVRLRPGTSTHAVEAAFLRDAERQYREFPRNNPQIWHPLLRPLKEAMAGEASRGFLLVCAAAGLLLLLAAANVAALFLNRAARRAGETAIRRSLGAGTGHLLIQTLPESLVVAGAAALLGLILAAQMGDLLRLWLPGGDALRGLGRAWGHPAVAAFTLALVLATGLLLGLLPLLQGRRIPLETDLRGGANTARGTHRVRDGLVVAQVALATLLLVGVSLLSLSLVRLLDRPLGFEPSGLVAVELEQRAFGKPAPSVDPRPLLQALGERPGIGGAALCGHIPGAWQEDLLLQGGASFSRWNGCSINVSREAATLEDSGIAFGLESVTPDYFRTLGLSLRSGRLFTSEEMGAHSKVCVLDEDAAHKLFPEGAEGKPLYIGVWNDFAEPGGLKEHEPLEVIGVVASHDNRGAESTRVPGLYLPATLLPPSRLLLRSPLSEPDLKGLVDQALQAHLPALRVHSLKNLRSYRWEQALPRRQLLALLVPFGALALLLAALGLGALLGSQVSQRTRELGIRAAYGATPGNLLLGVILRALRHTAIGLALGLGLSFLLVRSLKSLLFGVSGGDPAALTAALMLLLATALLAALIPALRAARVQPADALRSE